MILTRIDYKCGYGRKICYINPEHTKNKALKIKYFSDGKGWTVTAGEWEYSEPYPAAALSDLYSKSAKWYTKYKTNNEIYNYNVSRDTTLRATVQ